jgi:hypothetical protein
MFTFDSDNDIAARAGGAASADNLQALTSEKELAKLAELPSLPLA